MEMAEVFKEKYLKIFMTSLEFPNQAFIGEF